MFPGECLILNFKKRMQKVILFLFVGICGVFIGNQTLRTSVVVNDVLMENVEALASIEGSDFIKPVNCLMSGENKCPNEGERVKYVIEGLSLGEDEEIY